MNPMQALQVLDQAAGGFAGNRENHRVISEAVQVLHNFLLAHSEQQPEAAFPAPPME